MPKNKRAIGSDLAKVDSTTDADIARQIAEDLDTAPELTEDMLARANVYDGNKLIRRGRGRPKLEEKKVAVNVRLPPQVVAHFRAAGPGWQTRIGEALTEVVRRHGATKPLKQRKISLLAKQREKARVKSAGRHARATGRRDTVKPA